MPGTIHIVDDEASFRAALERRLRKAGYEVATYPSAQQLLDRLPAESEPGCILLDVRIPSLSGPELQVRLTELGSKLPIIFLTGHADIPTTVTTMKAGAEDFSDQTRLIRTTAWGHRSRHRPIRAYARRRAETERPSHPA